MRRSQQRTELTQRQRKRWQRRRQLRTHHVTVEVDLRDSLGVGCAEAELLGLGLAANGVKVARALGEPLT